MASAKTKTFELTAKVVATNVEDNQALDLTDYIDIADNEVFLLQEWSIMLDPNETFPATQECLFQLMDTNGASFFSMNNRTSLGVARIGYDNTSKAINTTYSMSADAEFGESLIVSRSIWCRNWSSVVNTLDHTLTIRGKIIRPTAKEYMALVLTQTGQVAV